MFGAAFLSFPVIATQIYMFVAPGLYRHERNAFLPYLVATPIFFVARRDWWSISSSCRCWCASRSACSRRRATGRPRSSCCPRSANISSLMMWLVLRLRRRVPAAGDPDAARPHRHHHLGARCKAKRRYFIVGAFVIAAVLTPPDVISQLSLAVPLLLLYEGSIWSVRMRGEEGRSRGRRDGGRRRAGEARGVGFLICHLPNCLSAPACQGCRRLRPTAPTPRFSVPEEAEIHVECAVADRRA